VMFYWPQLQMRLSLDLMFAADKEEIDVRSYSIIYDAINDLKDAMEGMLSPELREEVTGTAEIRETFKISKVGTVAGCMVLNGKIFRNSGVRLIREGVVVYTGVLDSLKRFKDDVKEVSKGYDCGMQIKNYNDINIGDVIEAFQEVEVKKKLK
jgi:translation initiation factor IF-2